MKIGVISDTHIPDRAKELPKRIFQDFAKVELILHAGDLIDLKVIQELRRLAKVVAVFGNMDPPVVRQNLKVKEIVRVRGFKIGLIHGGGNPRLLMEKVKDEFKEGVDAIVFGHAHYCVNEERGGVLFFNPGSPTDKIFSPYNSYGILDVTDRIVGKIIRL